LSNCKEARIHTLIEIFVKGLRDEEIKKEMRRKAVVRKDLTIEKIIEYLGSCGSLNYNKMLLTSPFLLLGILLNSIFVSS